MSKYDIEPALRKSLPVFFELLGDYKLNWRAINKSLEKKMAYRKERLQRVQQPILEDMSLIDLLVGVMSGREHAKSQFTFIRKMLEELVMHLEPTERVLIRDNLYGMVVHSDLKYMNFFGELCVLNQLKKRMNIQLIETEALHDPDVKGGISIDFKFYDRATSNHRLIEVVSIHLNQGVEYSDPMIENILSQKLEGKMRLKRFHDNPNFMLAPVLWGYPESIARFTHYYDRVKPQWNGILTPNTYLALRYKQGGVVYKFGSIDTIFFDCQELYRELIDKH